MSSMHEYSFKFSQGSDLLDRLKSSLYEIGYYSIAPSDSQAAREFSQGLCYALSAKFMMEERNHGIGGGGKYFNWLKNAIDSYKKNARISDGNISDIKSKLLMQYHRQFLLPEVEQLQKIQYSQYVKKIIICLIRISIICLYILKSWVLTKR